MSNRSLTHNYTRIHVLALVSILLAVLDQATSTFPAPLKPCLTADEACYVKQGQVYLDAFNHGIPERNVPSIEPVELGTVRVQIGSPESSMNMKLTMTNTTLHNFGGAMTLKTLKMTRKPNDLTSPFKVIFLASAPQLEVHADHELNGKILVLPIASKGKIVVKLFEFMVKALITFQPEKRADEHYYLRVTEFKLIEKINTGSIHLTNLFRNNEELSNSTLKLFNDEWPSLSADVTPKVMEAANRVLKKTLQSILDTIPYDEMFQN